MNSPELLAFDFDGVICDGLIEYFQTAWKAYCLLFNPSDEMPPEGIAEKFYPLRPVIETGWEMPMLIQALLDGKQAADIVNCWPQMARDYLQAAGLEQVQAAKTLDGVRDQWIQSDLSGWLALHRFYPGMIEKLRSLLTSHLPTYIVSTKEGRFIEALLAQNGVDFPRDRIIGKEVKRPKYETLRLLKVQHGVENIWFIEDRLPALKAVAAQGDLSAVHLFLADWGYNLMPDRATATQDSRIHLLSLEQVVQEFTYWQ